MSAETNPTDELSRKLAEAESRLRELDVERARLKAAEERERRLNSVLRGIRSVNQLIVRERDPRKLIEGAVEALVLTQGYSSCGIVVTPESGDRLVVAGGDSAGAERLRAELLHISLPYCVREASEGREVVLKLAGAHACTKCDACHTAPGREMMGVPLECEGATLGALLAIVPGGADGIADHLDLLREVAGDIALALWTIEREARMREADYNYRLLAENTSDVIWVVDVATMRFRYVSPSVERLRGFTAEEVKAQDITQALVPSSQALAARVNPERVAAFRRGARETYLDEIGLPRKDGTTVFVEASVRYAEDPATGRLEIHGTWRDITERRLAEYALRERAAQVSLLTRLYQMLSDTNEAIVRSDSEYNLFQNVCSIALGLPELRAALIFVHDPEANALRAVAASGPGRETSKASLLPLSVGPGERLPLTADAFLRGEVLVQNDYPADTLHHTSETETTEQRIGSIVSLPLRRDGKVGGVFAIIAEQKGYFGPEVVHLLESMAQDISFGLDHLSRARALRESEEQYRRLVENLQDVVYTFDDQGICTFVNGAIAQFGFSPQDLVGQTFDRFLPPEDLAEFNSRWADIVAGKPVTLNLRVFDSARKLRFVQTHIRPMTSGDRVVGFQGVSTDRTKQREVEEQLRMAQKMEAIGRLAGGVAHDFNNLLMVILSYTELALDSIAAEDPLRADLAEIHKAGERAASLTRQLLAFSRKQVLRPATLDLNTLVSGIEKMLCRLLGEDIELAFEPGSGLGTTRADAGQIEQVIMNLAVNARDAMPNGGKLSIQTSSVQLTPETRRMHDDVEPGDYVALTITDTGTGMDAATRAHIFEPFFTTKEPGRGTGLGLAMVYGIIKQSGGSIAVESEPGKGARFEVLLPREGSTGARDSARGKSGPRAGGNESILLVEDEEAVRKLARRILAGAGYSVITARNGTEALQICGTERSDFHMLLTDVVMPGMNGRELADRVVAMRPAIKILYMSGYTDDAVMQRGALHPGSHFLPKPFGGDALLQKVRAVLDGEA